MKISIITVCYNSSKYISDAIESVLMQDYQNIEYILVDGLSKDNTLEIIKSYAQKDSRIKWISEKDKGIYDAMNKGIMMATGDVIGVINSDDIYNSKYIISKVIDRFISNKLEALYGDLVYVKEENINKIKRYWKSGVYKENSFLLGWMPPHPTFFVKKEIYEKFGNFRLDMGTAADYEIMLRFIYKHKVKLGYIPEVMIRMRDGGASNQNLKARWKANKKDRKAWESNELRPYFFTIMLKPIRKLKQYIRR